MDKDSILAELKPCGFVLATSQYKYFALKCGYCNKKYAYWATFLQHLKRYHNDDNNHGRDAFKHFHQEIHDTIKSEIENIEDTEQQGFSSEIVQNNDTDMLFSSKGPEDIDEIDSQLVELLYENHEEESSSIENIENDLDTYTINGNTSVTESYDKYIESSQDELNTESSDIVSRITEINKVHINILKNDATMKDFIDIYKVFPLLWSTQESGIEVERQKQKMLNVLTKHNLINSMDDLEESILQIHQKYWDIRENVEKGISSTEEKYLTLCSFLNPDTKAELHEQRQTLHDTESEASFSQLNYFDMDSQGATDLSDHEIEVLQNNFQLKQSIIKFSDRNNITCNFIQCLRNQPCLWNSQDPAFNDSKKSMQAIDEIKEFFWDNYKLKLTEGKINSEIKRTFNFYNRCISSNRELNTTRKYYYELCTFLQDADFTNYLPQRSDILRKISFSTNDELTLGFIDFCAMHPVLWNKNDPNYSTLSKRKEAYDEIALNLQQFYNVEFSHEDLYYAISRLKNHYYSLQQKRNQSESLKKEEQDLLDRCSFLPTTNKTLKCHICQRLLRSQNTFQTHLRKVHNIGELPYKCDYCEQRFAQRNAKKEHEVRAHTKEFDWLCPFCGKGFVSRRDMEMHQMIHTGEKQIICELCGRSFRLKHQMTEHVKIIHERLRRFKCTMCPKDFLRKRQLDDHIRAHLNIRDKLCNICGKGFTNLHGLFRHKQLHTNKRYECIECGKCFHRFPALRAHKKRKHKISTSQGDDSMDKLDNVEDEENN